MFNQLLNLKIRQQFWTLIGVHALATLIILILALVGLESAKAQQANAVMSSMKSSQFLLVLTCLVLTGAACWLTNHVARNLEGTAQSIGRAVTALDQGDLRPYSQVHSRDEFGLVVVHLDQAIAKLREDMEALTHIGERTASGATQLSATASQADAATHEISVGADGQRLEVEQASHSINQIASIMMDIQNGITADVRQIEGMLKVGQKSYDSVEEATRAMAAIRESSTKISTITTVISEIADQTNLLSLNAAIEAAKALEYGRGFTVVAEEVRKLADRAAKAANEISGLTLESVQRAEAGTDSVNTVQEGLITLLGNIQQQASGAKGALSAVQHQVEESARARDRMATTLRITETSVFATHELSVSMSETARTIEDLAKTAKELRERTKRYLVN